MRDVVIADEHSILTAMLGNGVRQRLNEGPLRSHHYVLLVLDPSTGRTEVATSMSRKDTSGTLREVARKL